MRLISRMAVVLMALSVSACGIALDPPPPTIDLGAKHVLEKNYTLGRKGVAYVGEKMISVQDYHTESAVVPSVRPTKNFTYSGFSFSSERSYRILGKYTRENGTFNVVESDAPSLSLLVNDDGVIQNKYIMTIPDGRKLVPIPHATPDPADSKMDRITETKTSKTKGFINYQIIYNGTDGKSIFMTYREFTPDDMAKTAFYQNLTYSMPLRESARPPPAWRRELP